MNGPSDVLGPGPARRHERLQAVEVRTLVVIGLDEVLDHDLPVPVVLEDERLERAQSGDVPGGDPLGERSELRRERRGSGIEIREHESVPGLDREPRQRDRLAHRSPASAACRARRPGARPGRSSSGGTGTEASARARSPARRAACSGGGTRARARAARGPRRAPRSAARRADRTPGSRQARRPGPRAQRRSTRGAGAPPLPANTAGLV